jgi:hypothetical protein
MILLFLDLHGVFFTPPYSWRSQWFPFKARSIWAYVSPLPVLRPGSVQVENFFRTSGESNPRPWRWIKSIRNQHVKCNQRQTRPWHRAYYIGGATPFHSCMIVRSPKLVSSQGPICFLLLYRGCSPFTHCATSAGALRHQCRCTAPPVPVHCATSAGTLRHQCRIK